MKMMVSVVIPVFNEENAIVPCLEALFAQEEPADEIIVVDNGSTDGTLQKLKAYEGRIRVLQEPRPGVVFARTTGFDAARGDIIGRIDADTRVTPHWVATLKRIFCDPKTDAVTGIMRYYDLPQFLNTVDRKMRSLTVLGQDRNRTVFLNGSNMAIRRQAWESVRGTLCLEPGIHEDLDIAVHLRLQGTEIRFAENLFVHISARRIDDGFRKFYAYAMTNIKTYHHHHIDCLMSMRFIAWMLVIFHGFLKLMYRGYDPKKKKFSLLRAMRFRPVTRRSPLDV